MVRPGLWRFRPTSVEAADTLSAPLDIDDTALASMAFRRYRLSLLLRLNIPTMLKWRDEQGRFRTWMEEGYLNPVCAVVNANAVWYIGETAATKPAIRWLMELATDRTDQAHQRYYPGPMLFNHAVSRAAHESAPTLRAINRVLEERVMNEVGVGIDRLSALNAAQAVCTLVRVGAGANRLVTQLGESLLQRQRADGSWPIAPAWGGHSLPSHIPGMPTGRLLYWGSAAITTAVAVEALTMMPTMRH
jgi:hypothetical protein